MSGPLVEFSTNRILTENETETLSECELTRIANYRTLNLVHVCLITYNYSSKTLGFPKMKFLVLCCAEKSNLTSTLLCI